MQVGMQTKWEGSSEKDPGGPEGSQGNLQQGSLGLRRGLPATRAPALLRARSSRACPVAYLERASDPRRLSARPG